MGDRKRSDELERQINARTERAAKQARTVAELRRIRRVRLKAKAMLREAGKLRDDDA